MTYSKYEKVEAIDFNTLTGTSVTTTANTINSIWGTGNGSRGYGQTAIPQVAEGVTITAGDWANVTNKTANIAAHQGTTITAVTTPAVGATITQNSAVVTNIGLIYTNKNNAAAQGTSSEIRTAANSSWSDRLTWTHTITFSSGDNARYFFNAGGQIKITMTHGASGGINDLFKSMVNNLGTLVLSGHTSGTARIAGVDYTGFKQVLNNGISASTGTLSNPNLGYYGLSTTDTEAFRQGYTSGPAGYTNSFISVKIRTNGTQGSNGDNGNVITITTVWDEVPNGYAVAGGTGNSTVSAFIQYPLSAAGTLPTASWGTVTGTGSLTGA